VVSLPVSNELDIIRARQEVRSQAEGLGFRPIDQTRIATAVSELVRNIVQYAGRGSMDLDRVLKEGRTGLRIICSDQGPGIPDIRLAMTEGFSTSGGGGFGLPGAKRLVDLFEIWSEVMRGTRVMIVKWR
jgi:serine/threonine-protein kinase RsbT